MIHKNGNKLVNSKTMTAEQKKINQQNLKLKSVEIFMSLMRDKMVAVSSFDDVIKGFQKVEDYLTVPESRIATL